MPLTLALAGCSLAPAYHVPTTAAPAEWKPVEGWVPAVPADGTPRGEWWLGFADPDLNRLIRDADAGNQTLAAAAANYATARATAREARAALFPSIVANGSADRFTVGSQRVVVSDGNTAGSTPTIITSGSSVDTYTLGIGARWEPDLFGRIGGAASAQSLSAEAARADLISARLAIHGEVAANYLGLRATDEVLRLLDRSTTSYEQSLRIATERFAAGLTADTDVLLARAQLERIRADRDGSVRLRAEYENAIAALVGSPAPAFRIASRREWAPAVHAVPPVIPSDLLQRRPDIAAAERRVAAANARIGVARAAFFPQFGLTANVGTSSGHLGGLFGAAASLWSLGAAAVLPLLDFGARSARLSASRAAYDATVADYRGRVLDAFRDVQNNLTAQTVLARQSDRLALAADAAQRAETSARQRYAAGLVYYADVAIAEQAALDARRALVQTQLARQVAAVALFQSIGGDAEGSPAAAAPR